jgi:hypothetical protein
MHSHSKEKMFASRTFGARDAELQSTMIALYKCHYRVHEDVVGIMLHDDFRAEALRGEYYTISYLRHRLPLLFRLALCKWRPHPHPQKKKTSLLHKRSSGGLGSTDRLSFRGDSHNDDDGSDADAEDAQHHHCPLHHQHHRSDGGSRSGGNSFSTSAKEGCRSSLLSGAGGSLSDDSQRETWSPDHTPAPSASGVMVGQTTIDGAGPRGTEGLTKEQQTQLSVLALQILCGDRSRVREGSAEAVTATCGPLWDVHTVRSFYDDHRRLVRWTCRVLHASCEWMEDVVRRAVDDELLEQPSPVNSPTRNTNSFSGADELAHRSPVTASSSKVHTTQLSLHTVGSRRARQARTVSVEARRLPCSSDYSPCKDTTSPLSVNDSATPDEEGDAWQQSTRLADDKADADAGWEGREAITVPHLKPQHYRRHRSEPAPMSSRPPRPPPLPQTGGVHTPLHPTPGRTLDNSTTRPPPLLPQPHAGASVAASSSASASPAHPQLPPIWSNLQTTFTSTAELETLLELHCRRIRHALMVLESLLVSLVFEQSYIYRTQPGRSNTPPWLRRKSSSSSSNSSSDAFNVNSEADDDDGGDDDVADAQSDDGSGNEGNEGGLFNNSGTDGSASRNDSFLNHSGIGGFARLRRPQKSASKNGGLCNSIFEYRTDTCSSFNTDHGGDEGHDEAYIMQMEAEADEPPLDLLVRHCLHAFTQTFLSITAVQQQLQEYSHESRHAPASTTTAAANRSFAVVSAAPSSGDCSSPWLLPTAAALCPNRSSEKSLSNIISPVAPTESEAPSLVAARGTPAAYACPKCKRFHRVEEVLLVAANDNLEVLKKSAIAFAAHHSAIAEESIRIIDAEGAVFTSQATMLLAHVLTPDLLTAHPPGSRGGMALEWVLNYVFGGCSGADVRQHQQQQERQHVAGVADANSSFDCFSLANSSFCSTNPQSVDASDADGRSSDGGWRSLGGDQSRASDGGYSSSQSSGKWNVSRFECNDDSAFADGAAVGQPVHSHNADDDTNSDGEPSPQHDSAQDQPGRQATNMRVEYIMAACFTRCHPLMTVIGCVAENNQYNCGRTVAQAVLQYAFTLSQTSARLLRTPLLTNTWSTPFTEAMMRGLSELAAHARQSVSVTPTIAQPGSGGLSAGGAANLTWSFASSSAAMGAAAGAARAAGPPQLMGPDRNFAPLLAAQLNVPTSLVSSAMRQVSRPRPYAFIPPPAAVVTGATPADESEVAQVRTMRRCLALHWAKCVLLSARTLTRAGTYDVSVPFEHYVNIRNARRQLRGRMMEYRDRMREHFEHAGNYEKVRRMDEVFERWETDERRMLLNDMNVAEDSNDSFTTATAQYTVQGSPTTSRLYTVDPSGSVSPAPTNFNGCGADNNGGDTHTAEGSVVQSHFDSNRNSHTMTATFASFAVSTGPSSKAGMTGPLDPVQDQLLLPQPDNSNPGSIGADPLGRSFDGTNGTTLTEKESYRRAFVDSFCFGKSDFELLSAALLGRSRTAVQVPIHVIVYTSLFSILEAMGDVLLCEKPRLSSVVANELLTLLYEAQLSMLEPLHDGAMAVVERTSSQLSDSESDTDSGAASPDASSLCTSPAMICRDSGGGETSDTSDSFVSPGSSLLPSTVASQPSSPSGSPAQSSSASSCSSASSVTVSSDGSGSQPASPSPGNAQGGTALGQQHRRCSSSSSGDDSGSEGAGGDMIAEKKEKRRGPKHKKHEASTTITRDGHILLFNEYALLLEAGLRSPQVVRRWRNEVHSNPDHAARGYLSLLDHLQYRQSQWAEPSQDEYLVSRSTLRLMLGVTARDARGNMHGNLLHVDDLDVMGSRKEEVAPRLGVTSSKDSMTMMYSEEWDPSMVDLADAQTQGSYAAGASSDSNSSSSDQVIRNQGPSADSMGHNSADSVNEHGGGGSSDARKKSVHEVHTGDEAGHASPVPRSDQLPGEAFITRGHAMSAPGIVMSAHVAAPTSPGDANGAASASPHPHLKTPALLGRPPLPTAAASPTQTKSRVLGPRTSSFECVSLLGTRLETSDDGTPLQAAPKRLQLSHHSDRVHPFVDADDIGGDSDDDSEGADDVDTNDDEQRDDDHRHHRRQDGFRSDCDSGDSGGEDDHHSRCAGWSHEGLENISFVSAETYGEEVEEREVAGVSESGAAAAGTKASEQVSPHLTQEDNRSSHSHTGGGSSPPHPHHNYSSSGSSHGSHTHNHTNSHRGHHAHHVCHARPPYAPWRHVPTRVTLAGTQADMGTMVKRMPATWTLKEPPQGNTDDETAAAATTTTTPATGVVVYALVNVTSATIGNMTDTAAVGDDAGNERKLQEEAADTCAASKEVGSGAADEQQQQQQQMEVEDKSTAPTVVCRPQRCLPA